MYYLNTILKFNYESNKKNKNKDKSIKQII